MQSNFKNFDWKGMAEKLPVKKTDSDRAERRKLWKKMDANGNGFLSLAEFDKGVLTVLNLPDVFNHKKVITAAFHAAKDKIKGKAKQSKDYVEWLEFRYILIYLRQYFEYYVMFCRVNESDNFKISLDEFKKALKKLNVWGAKIENPEAEFKKIDKNGGGVIMFAEFCEYAIHKDLDLEDDDDFDEKA